MFALDVPKGDVHRALGRREGASLVAWVVAVEAFVPETLVGQRVLTDEQRGKLGVDVLAHGVLLYRAGEAVAGDA